MLREVTLSDNKETNAQKKTCFVYSLSHTHAYSVTPKNYSSTFNLIAYAAFFLSATSWHVLTDCSDSHYCHRCRSSPPPPPPQGELNKKRKKKIGKDKATLTTDYGSYTIYTLKTLSYPPAHFFFFKFRTKKWMKKHRILVHRTRTKVSLFFFLKKKKEQFKKYSRKKIYEYPKVLVLAKKCF